jgi:hypothetical protein
MAFANNEWSSLLTECGWWPVVLFHRFMFTLSKQTTRISMRE